MNTRSRSSSHASPLSLQRTLPLSQAGAPVPRRPVLPRASAPGQRGSGDHAGPGARHAASVAVTPQPPVGDRDGR
ncbi:MAG: hypothetical protein KJZ81_18125 [Burkholderiaceae bacterium]|jgi:hypothetical protein|nr:hypothetical protein [Burkholderiaceae bacterium]